MVKHKFKSHLIGDKGMQLFPDSEMIARKSVNQQEFESKIGPENAYKLVLACEKGIEKSKEELNNRPESFKNRNYNANTVNSNIQGFLIEQFPQESKFCKGSRFSLEINGQKIFPKKIGKGFWPSNVQTRAVQMYNEQLTDDISEVLPITYLGYQLSPSCTDLKGVYAVHICGGHIEWVSDIAGIAYEGMHSSSSTLSESSVIHNQDEDEDSIPVKVKTGKFSLKKKIE